MGSTKEPITVSRGGVIVPDIGEVLKRAKSLPPPTVYRSLHEYGASIHVMIKEKKMTHKEIAQWLCEQGIQCSATNISMAYQKWCALHPQESGDTP